jgi:hypothetical protein
VKVPSTNAAKELIMNRFLIRGEGKVALVVLLALCQVFPTVATGKSAVKIAKGGGQVDLSGGLGTVAPFVFEGDASHIGQFTAVGEVRLEPGDEPGSIVGEGIVVFIAANGDLLVGDITWDLRSVDARGELRTKWRDSVRFDDGTVVHNTGRFVNERPPGALIAAEWVFVSTILILGIITGLVAVR